LLAAFVRSPLLAAFVCQNGLAHCPMIIRFWILDETPVRISTLEEVMENP